MFSRKPQEPKLVGATEKLATAERMRKNLREQKEQQFGIKVKSQFWPVTIIFLMAAGLAGMMLGVLPGTVSKHHPDISDIAKVLLGSGIPQFTGDANMDWGILILIRGTVLFLVAGIIPFLSFLVVEAVGIRRLSPYVAFWGVLVLLGLSLYPLREIIMSVAKDLLQGT